MAEYGRRATAVGLTWPLPEPLDDTALERQRFATTSLSLLVQRPAPDWATIHQELKRPHVT